MERLPAAVSNFTNIETVFGRIERRGHLQRLVALVEEMRKAEENDLLNELEEEADLAKCSAIFKDNFKLLAQLVGTSYLHFTS